MSFTHRFGVGIGGSYEDPYIYPCCEVCPDEKYDKCKLTQELIYECMKKHEGKNVTN